MVKRAYHRPDHLLVSVLDMARIKIELYPLTSSFLHLLVGTAMKTVTPVIGMDRQIRWDRFFYYECFVNVGIANNFLTRERRTRQTPGINITTVRQIITGFSPTRFDKYV